MEYCFEDDGKNTYLGSNRIVHLQTSVKILKQNSVYLKENGNDLRLKCF